MSSSSLQGQTALITGGGRGIGRAIAEALGSAGASIILSARTAEEVRATAETLRARDIEALGVVADIADPDDIRRLVDEAVEGFGTVDILVNNAGILPPVGLTWEVDPDEWGYNVQVNLIAAFRLCHAVLPLMIEEGSGRIVNISTASARAVTAGWSAYSAAKAGLDHFTRVLAAEVFPHGVRVNAVNPGVTNTRMQADIRAMSPDQFSAVERFRQYHALGQLRDPREPADLVLWLCTPAARDLTGQVFDINDPAVRERAARDLGRGLG